MKVQQMDATDLYCPEFSLPVRRFLNDLPLDAEGHIVTKEKKAHLRLEHICASFGWMLKGPVIENKLIHFIVNKQPGGGNS